MTSCGAGAGQATPGSKSTRQQWARQRACRGVAKGWGLLSGSSEHLPAPAPRAAPSPSQPLGEQHIPEPGASIMQVDYAKRVTQFSDPRDRLTGSLESLPALTAGKKTN